MEKDKPKQKSANESYRAARKVSKTASKNNLKLGKSIKNKA